jgi:hypothetical protein
MEQEQERRAEAHAEARARENGPWCAQCGGPLRSAREQSSGLCDWCEENLNPSE